MATVSESDIFVTGIYQLETTDPVEGGENGVDNLQAKQLASRTLWLKNRLAEANTVISNLTTALGQEATAREQQDADIRRYLPKARGYTNAFDIANLTPGQSIGAVGLTSCIVQSDEDDNSVLRVVFPVSITGSNYSVVISVETVSTNIVAASTIFIPVWKKVSTSSIDIVVREASAITQSVKLHIQVYDLN